VIDDGQHRRTSDDVTALMIRIEALERHNIASDQEHVAFRTNDGQTAAAVDKLANAINDPRSGLIVELSNFRSEVASDRRVFKAWIAGAVAALSFVFTIVTVYAPAIRTTLGVGP
jgi:hypothetical protein